MWVFVRKCKQCVSLSVKVCVYERKCKRSACVCECLNNGACVGLFVVRKGMYGGGFSMMGYVSVHVCMCEWACVRV